MTIDILIMLQQSEHMSDRHLGKIKIAEHRLDLLPPDVGPVSSGTTVLPQRHVLSKSENVQHTFGWTLSSLQNWDGIHK